MLARPQPALFVEQTAHHVHVEWTLKPGAHLDDVVAAIAQARAAASGGLRAANLVWGFDPALWRKLGELPTDVHPFAGVTGPAGVAPATQAAIWLWAAGNAHEKVWAAADAANQALAPVAELAREQVAYTPFDDRDPIGFVDGTENPPPDEAVAVALVPAGPGAGGTIVLLQKWVHDLAAFRALPVVDQERVIGRTRADDIELEGDAHPPTSHVARNSVRAADGTARRIYRRNTPFASLAEVGSMFVGCTNDQRLMDELLDRMYGVTEDGLTDHLVRFSTPVSGSYYFCPALDALEYVFGTTSDAAAAADTDALAALSG